jgi:hypothetical protein
LKSGRTGTCSGRWNRCKALRERALILLWRSLNRTLTVAAPLRKRAEITWSIQPE